jgi:hypothetical protein
MERLEDRAGGTEREARQMENQSNLLGSGRFACFEYRPRIGLGHAIRLWRLG